MKYLVNLSGHAQIKSLKIGYYPNIQAFFPCNGIDIETVVPSVSLYFFLTPEKGPHYGNSHKPYSPQEKNAPVQPGFKHG